MQRNIVLCGIKHCGKSTLGKLLSKKLNINFYDVDDFIAKISNQSCRDLFNKQGKEEFKNIELLAVKEILNFKELKVIATGGGICDNQPAYNLLKKNGILIFLHLNSFELYNRIKEKGFPSFIKSKADFDALYEERSNFYKKNCDFIINLDENKCIEENFDNFYDHLKSLIKL